MRRWLILYAVLPLAYIVFGRLGLVLAVPPGYATAVFLPAGMAVAAVFMAGAAALPGVLVGSFLLNIWIGYDVHPQVGIVTLAVAFAIAFASMLQAAIGGDILRRAIGYPSSFDNPRDILLFLLLSPIVCLTSSTLSLTGMWALGAVQSTDLLINWVTWWVGDTLGTLVALPLMLVLVGEPRGLWRSRALFVAVPMCICFGLFIVIFIRVSSLESDQSLLEFRLRSQHLADNMKSTLDEQVGFLDQLSNVFVGRRLPVSRQEFHDLVQPLLRRFPTVQAVEWAARVRSSERASYEAAQQTELPGFSIRQRDDSGELRAADDRLDYFPVTYLEPSAGNEPALGFDLLSDPIRRAAVETTIRNGAATATAPIRLVQEDSEQFGILLTRAVTSGATGPGVVVVVLRMGTYTSTAVGPFRSTLGVRLVDKATGISFFDNTPQLPLASYETGFDFAGRQYLVTTTPTSEYLAQHRGWQSWAVLASGVLGTGLLGALLMLGTGHAYRMERVATQLRETATIIEASRDAIWSWAIDGTINSWNHEAERMFGYAGKEIIGKSILTLIPADRKELAHDVISKVSRGRAYAAWETIRLRKDGTPLPVELSVSPIRDAAGAVIGAATVCRDITARKAAEALIAADLRDMMRLNQLSNELVREDAEFTACLEKVVETAIGIAGSQKGAVQLFEPGSQSLRIVTQRGFGEPFLKFFEQVKGDAAAGAAVAMRIGARVVVEDVLTSPIFEGRQSRVALLKEDIRAVIATPLQSSKGNVLGVITTHFREPHHPSERDLNLLDLLARQAADYLERKKAEETERNLVSEKAKAEADLRLREAELSRVQEIGGVAGFHISVSPSLVSRRSPEYLRLHGLSDRNAIETHEDWLRRVHPDDRDVADRTLRHALSDPACLLYEGEYRIVRPNDRQTRWIYARAHIERDDDGQATRLIGAPIDITERKKSERQQELLMAELDHRVKNVLTVVQAFAQQSFEDPQEAAAQRFIGRLTALSQTHTLLAESRWEGARLDRLLERVFDPFGALLHPRISYSGPEVQLEPKAAQGLALAFHELLTNACKYGALANNRGRVAVRWTVIGQDRGDQLSIVWRETGGPAVEEAPRRTGFGSRLIALTALDLGGIAEMQFDRGGLEVTFKLPLGPMISTQ
jgi:PAS domain S-box-containing protein